MPTKRSKSSTYGNKMLSELRAVLGPAYEERVDKGLSGDADAAYTLVMSAGKYAACLPLIAFYLDIPEPGFSKIVETVWIYQSESLVHFHKNHYRMYIRKFLSKASIDLSGLPEGEFKVYRGVSGVSARIASTGLSWTYSYNAACWFALRFNNPDPLVVEASVNKSDVIFHSVKQGEYEVILRSSPRYRQIDDLDEWKKRAAIRKSEIDKNGKKH